MVGVVSELAPRVGKWESQCTEQLRYLRPRSKALSWGETMNRIRVHDVKFTKN